MALVNGVVRADEVDGLAAHELHQVVVLALDGGGHPDAANAALLGRTRLWQRVKGRQVPDWAREFDANSWAQFFLKCVASHPAVTAITPATSRVANMADNMGGALGQLPNRECRGGKRQLA